MLRPSCLWRGWLATRQPYLCGVASDDRSCAVRPHTPVVPYVPEWTASTVTPVWMASTVTPVWTASTVAPVWMASTVAPVWTANTNRICVDGQQKSYRTCVNGPKTNRVCVDGQD